ncbi:MAG: S8 family serine peptidase, partial [Ignavibacteriaceae bacterium]
VISVGNSTIDDFVSGSSNYGSTLDLVAPGSSIVTTARNNNYASISGTSAATPHVAATAALILSLQHFTNEEVKQIIKSTSDDIGEPGWDLRSGAGRLNLFRALTVIAPSVIKINSPTQDFATLDDQITVNASVLSASFVSYSLYYGTGYNPVNWITLIENEITQFNNEDIYSLDISSLPDTVYAFRLEVQLSNARTLEERVNFHISRTPPVTELISIGPAYYGDKTTILASMTTDEPSLVRMFYKRLSEQEFNFITLDGFTTNNQFIKELHYGFIPRQIVEQNSAYEVYFEAENLVGLSTLINDGGSNFIFSTRFQAEYSGESELPYSLPSGSIFEDPVSLTTTDSREIYLREITSTTVSSLFRLNNDIFEEIDSLDERIVRDFGDFNNNGLNDVLAFFIRDGFIYEQTSAGSSSLTEEFAQEEEDFWPVMAADIDDDSKTEIVVVDSDTSFTVWKVDSVLSVSNPIRLVNFTEESFGYNVIDAPNGVIADINGDDRNEFWSVDLDGDVFSYEIFGTDDYRQGSVITTGFIGSAAFIAAGDYNGDGIDELGVLLHSIPQVDIAPFYRLIVFNLIGDNFNVLYDQALIDAASEFNSAFQRSENSVRFADLDNDLSDELIVFMFPYSFIFKYDSGINRVISYKENINSNSVFVGDLNLNGVTEIAFPTADGIKFYEFAVSIMVNTPYNLNGFSADSSTVQLTWNGNVDQYYIYRGTEQNNLELIDSTFTDEYLDIQLNNNTTYYYAVQAFDPLKQIPLSNLSSQIEVYVHVPGKVLSAEALSATTVTVTFSEKMNNTIENLQAFELMNVGIPNSVAPANQFAYLLTFREPIPMGGNQLLIKDLKDFYGSPIESALVQFTMDSTTANQEFFISSFKIENPYLIRVTFNFDVDETSAQNVGNYFFEPDNKVTSITIDENNNKSILINLNGQKPVGSIGKEYVLHVKNIKSSSSSGNIGINSGAGSYIVLTGFANDLSDVYAYPNPAEIGTGITKITFANLPQYANITIWTLDGTKVGEVEENDGNGGADFNLSDFSGAFLASGIYIYRIVMLDEFDNESDEKIGKFAVVR